jgi:soluble lytic murein transglycosylase-like protein
MPPADTTAARAPEAPADTTRRVPRVDLAVPAPRLGPPREDRGTVDWTPIPATGVDATGAIAALRAAVTASDSLEAWRLAANGPLRSVALRRLALAAAARGERERADSCWALLAAIPSPWEWEAVRERVDLARDSGDFALADSLLRGSWREDRPDLERAAWLLRRARVRLALGDTARALEASRLAVRDVGATRPALDALALLESLTLARGERLAPADVTAAAEVELANGEREAAIRRLRREAARVGGASGFAMSVRLAEILRGARRFTEARAALARIETVAADSAARARGLLERARVERDAGREAEAEAAYGLVITLAREPRVLEAAGWESGQELEQSGDWDRARERYLAVARLGGARRDECALRVGLLWLAEAEPERALGAWSGIDTEPARFWSAVVRRGRDRAAADSALARIASLPGYGFYRACARETLGVRGWPGDVARDSCVVDSVCAPLATVRDLLAANAVEEAMLTLNRWSVRDPRVAGAAGTRDAGVMLGAARLAYAAGRTALGIRLATAAAELRDTSAVRSFGRVVWIYPAAFDSLYARFPLTPGAGAPDRALLQALTWQESKFDPRARSRSNAIGLTQLKRATAAEVARRRHEAPPGEIALTDPARNLTLGADYLAGLITRFGGRVSLALAGYNAGASTISPRAPLWIERGGEALAAELVAYPETRDYVKRILGMRQAYRELRPRGASW